MTVQEAGKTTEPKPESGKQRVRGVALLQEVLLPVLAVFTGLVVGGIIIALSNDASIAAWRNFFQSPGAALKATWDAISIAYGALFRGALGSPKDLIAAFGAYRATGDNALLLKAIYPISESLVAATPYILAGLAVAVGFRCGLFNIGAEGQLLMGALGTAFIGYSIKGLPAYIHLPFALLGGALAGAIWGAIPGYLKAKFGAHEVVNTIMMNWIAFRLSDWLLFGPM
ncbi:MAG: hypothetical protein MUO77_19630, partial [Anaerolineales bacterium]|nr:hypothetical protein [Anaerolineales bacterium]